MRLSGPARAALFCAFSTVWAGDAVIKGTVRDAETGLALPHAWVRVGVHPMSGNVFAPQKEPAQGPLVETSDTGSFELTVAVGPAYSVQVHAEGYITPAIPMIRPTEGEAAKALDIRLQRPGSIQCRIVDGETKKPVSGIHVSIGQVMYRRGEPALVGTFTATTGAEGTFSTKDLTPGQYGLEVHSIAEELAGGREPDFEDETKRPAGVWRMFWPPLYDGAGALTLDSGQNLNLGDIPVRRQPLYRIRGEARTSNCAAGDTVQVGVDQQYGSLHARRANLELPCGARFTVKNLSPGAYQLTAHLRRKPLAERAYALAEVTITDRDVEVELEPQLPARIAVQLHLPEGTVLDQPLRFRFEPRHHMPFDDEGPFEVDAKGQAVAYWLDRGELGLWWYKTLPEGFYVQKATYNGVAIDSSRWQTNRYALAHSLEIWLSERGATLTGLVKQKDDAVADARVTVVSWPAPAGEFPATKTATTDAAGRFTLKGLAPGHYRVIACVEADRSRLQMPGVLAGLAGAAKDVELAEGGASEITVQLAPL
jgi:hypothetical protein